VLWSDLGWLAVELGNHPAKSSAAVSIISSQVVDVSFELL
jgi:hypothetical protein